MPVSVGVEHPLKDGGDLLELARGGLKGGRGFSSFWETQRREGGHQTSDRNGWTK
ncbi:hypothetical protein [Methanogenium cariaci]|uniref:hypothetical protein n=1 Tax=Methanogenium cariaci TaxID=2197 RepID=UPI0012F628A9|nr:hypothetical protein [Methanogenium cariaci]